MAQIRNISGDDRIVNGRLVLRGACLEVPVEEAFGLTQQVTNWEPVDEEAKADFEHWCQVCAYVLALEAEAAGPGPQEIPAVIDPPVVVIDDPIGDQLDGKKTKASKAANTTTED